MTAMLVKTNCSPIAAAVDGTMVWNARNAAGIFDAYIGDSNGNGGPLLPARDGNRGAADITADGRYVLLVTAVGWDRSMDGAQPGKGSGNAIQLFDRQTGKLSTLLAGATSANRGVIWPRFNAAGTKITWSQMLRSPWEAPTWGAWALHVADVDLAAGTLSNDRAWQEPGVPSAMYEPYGWVPGTDRVVYMATAGTTGAWTAAMQLFTLPDRLAAAQHGTRISPPMATFYPWEQPGDAYHEFVTFRPGDPNHFYTSLGVAAMGADLWSYDLRTADTRGLLAQPRRVSYFGGNLRGTWAVAGYPAPQYSIVGGGAWVGDTFVVGVCRDLGCSVIDAYRIDGPWEAT